MTTTAVAAISSCSSCYCSSSSSSFCSSYKFNNNNMIRLSVLPQSNKSIHHYPLSTFSIGGGVRRPTQYQHQQQQQGSISISSSRLLVSCQVALKNSIESSSEEERVSNEEDKEMKRAQDKIGSRVKVKVPLKVYHVPKISELDLTGMEGELKQYVGLWKGKRISANFPFKVQFITQIEDRTVKFFTHLREDEFDYITTTTQDPPPQV